MWNQDQYYLGLPGVLLVAVFCWAVIGVVVVVVGRWLRRERRPASPREILDGRLARGEIDVEEYHRLRATLAEREPAVGPR